LKAEGGVIGGYSCSRGFKYAQREQHDPRRSISGSVRVKNGTGNVVTVKTSAPIPKDLLLQAADLLDKTTISAPIKTGDIIIADICGTGIDFIAARSMKSDK
jgi:CxxC motif-containing protein